MALCPTKKQLSRSGKSLLLRSAAPIDAARAMAFDKEALASSTYVVATSDEVVWPFEEQYKTRLAKFLDEDGSLILLAEQDGELIGKLEFRSGQKVRNQHKGYFDMVVRAENRGQGIGAILLEALIEWAKENPLIEVIGLEVAAENLPAVALYRKMGFVEIGRDPYAMKIGAEYLANLSMCLRVK